MGDVPVASQTLLIVSAIMLLVLSACGNTREPTATPNYEDWWERERLANLSPLTQAFARVYQNADSSSEQDRIKSGFANNVGEVFASGDATDILMVAGVLIGEDMTHFFLPAAVTPVPFETQRRMVIERYKVPSFSEAEAIALVKTYLAQKVVTYQERTANCLSIPAYSYVSFNAKYLGVNSKWTVEALPYGTWLIYEHSKAIVPNGRQTSTGRYRNFLDC